MDRGPCYLVWRRPLVRPLSPCPRGWGQGRSLWLVSSCRHPLLTPCPPRSHAADTHPIPVWIPRPRRSPPTIGARLEPAEPDAQTPATRTRSRVPRVSNGDLESAPTLETALPRRSEGSEFIYRHKGRSRREKPSRATRVWKGLSGWEWLPDNISADTNMTLLLLPGTPAPHSGLPASSPSASPLICAPSPSGLLALPQNPRLLVISAAQPRAQGFYFLIRSKAKTLAMLLPPQVF